MCAGGNYLKTDHVSFISAAKTINNYEMTVDLGFVEKSEPWKLESRYFPSKVGGKPAWLDLEHIPTKKDLECEYCGNPCIFLCQVYAPFEDEVACFHRTVYVFVCKRSECCKTNSNGNLKVFRCQLKRDNPYYPSEPPVESSDWRTDIGVNQWAKTCHTCGIFASSHCAKCKIVNYCSREHQVQDWKMGHKSLCGNKALPSTSNTLLFPEYELVIEAEEQADENNEINDVELERREIFKYNEMLKKGETGVFQNQNVDSELIKMANNINDDVFSLFRERIAKYPDQVLRYDRGGEPLYISSDNQVDELPKCSQCCGNLQFEFQIMPQLLNFLNLTNPLESIDWGTLVVYTCKQSCTIKAGYTKEHIWKQDVSQNIIE